MYFKKARKGSVNKQQVMVYNTLADFWKDSIRSFEPYIFYVSEASKLDNSEKKLTFAAQLFLEGLRGEQDEARLNWETTEAIDLFERAIKLNPGSDDLRIGLGSCYVFGKGRNGNPQETMKGIQELLAVARKDTGNMKAQLVLGVGGLVSGQFDKAITRFEMVNRMKPAYIDAILLLAEVYERMGEKVKAIGWYQKSIVLAKEAQLKMAIEKRIEELKK